eukprot:CAMPEP_0169397800 /NCGR_PEP_ID=MMETSP1017-20121227/52238_1 /TAXON_ID=342587 /ORGANISM="Karlodinium micrum, Strain CCMP2283" /LENGTH=47 /DNA_ID= /DNA_START= /DNA_END= /DNA_ORIENTATION=
MPVAMPMQGCHIAVLSNACARTKASLQVVPTEIIFLAEYFIETFNCG